MFVGAVGGAVPGGAALGSPKSEVLVKLLESFSDNLAFPALLISAGLLILVSNRDAFEVDAKPFEQTDAATGLVAKKMQWKYMSDRAQNARLELLHIIRVVRWLATSMVVLAFVQFVAAGLASVVEWAGYAQFAEAWNKSESVNLFVRHGMALYFVATGPILIFRLARVTANIVRARSAPEDNKPTGWTAYN